MDKRSSTFGLSSENLARILKIGTDSLRADEQTEQDKRKASLLRDRLSISLPLEAVIIESLPSILARVCRQFQPMASKSLGNLLQDPKVNIEVLKKIKDYSKELVKTAKSDDEHEAAAAVYYAAIASALVFHDKRITKHSYESLEETFSSLIKSKWLIPELIRLFKKAQRLSKKKVK